MVKNLARATRKARVLTNLLDNKTSFFMEKRRIRLSLNPSTLKLKLARIWVGVNLSSRNSQNLQLFTIMFQAASKFLPRQQSKKMLEKLKGLYLLLTPWNYFAIALSFGDKVPILFIRSKESIFFPNDLCYFLRLNWNFFLGFSDLLSNEITNNLYVCGSVTGLCV